MGTEQISLLGELPPKPPRWRPIFACFLSTVVSSGLLVVSTHMIIYLPNSWDKLAVKFKGWLAAARLDTAVSSHLLSIFRWASDVKSNLLASLAIAALLHLLLSLLLAAGIFKLSRPLILPWLVSQAFVLSLTAIAFTACTFLSLFVSLPLAVVSPLAGGLFLGLCLHLWRAVAATYADSKRGQKPRVVRSIGAGNGHWQWEAGNRGFLHQGPHQEAHQGLHQAHQEVHWTHHHPKVIPATRNGSRGEDSRREGANILCKS